MGGINHQPCRNYLAESTKLSRSMSLARISFEQANVSLEEVILAELGGKTSSCDGIIAHLKNSSDHIGGMMNDITALTKKMDDLHFVDLPTLHSIDHAELGRRLVHSGMVSAVSWDEVTGVAQHGGFRNVLSVILERTRELNRRTTALSSLLTALGNAARGGNLHIVLEENRPGNIKEAFAQLYREWADFQQFFLASSMASTEQWYVYMNYGSLVGRPTLRSAHNRATIGVA